MNATKPAAYAYKLTDELGLYLLILPAGGRLWRMNYRFDGKQKTLAFGDFPDLSLAKTREQRAAVREALALGDDPSEKSTAAERESRAKLSETFRVISAEWLKRLTREGRAEKTLGKLWWLVDFALLVMGDRPIADLTVPKLLEALERFPTSLDHCDRVRKPSGKERRAAGAGCPLQAT